LALAGVTSRTMPATDPQVHSRATSNGMQQGYWTVQAPPTRLWAPPCLPNGWVPLLRLSAMLQRPSHAASPCVARRSTSSQTCRAGRQTRAPGQMSSRLTSVIQMPRIGDLHRSSIGAEYQLRPWLQHANGPLSEPADAVPGDARGPRDARGGRTGVLPNVQRRADASLGSFHLGVTVQFRCRRNSPGTQRRSHAFTFDESELLGRSLKVHVRSQ
jgi:hypothetical protein